MRKYLSFFRMRFIAGLQYRAAAFAGIITQFFWGLMELLLFRTFYEADAGAFPMSFRALVSYIWLNEAFLAMFIAWFADSDIFQSIMDGSIAYELCRPIQIYDMWFTKVVAGRLSKTVLRCMPILIIAVLLPEQYRLSLPSDTSAFLWFVITLVLSLLLVAAFSMIIFTAAFYTISSNGFRVVVLGIVEFLSGNVIPLPFFPDRIRKIVELLPFASMQNVPLRIYSGDIMGIEILKRAGLQLFWLIFMVILGKYLIHKALCRAVIQGG